MDALFGLCTKTMNLTCQGHITENFPVQIATHETKGCNHFGFISDDWQVLVTPADQVTLTCHGIFVTMHFTFFHHEGMIPLITGEKNQQQRRRELCRNYRRTTAFGRP